MAIDWVIAGKVALAAGQAFLAHLQGRKNEQARERDRELILAAITRLREDVLDTLIELEVIQLRGELEGFQQTYAAYDPDPQDPNEEARLVSLIDDSARVLGRIGEGMDRVGSQEALALESWSVYVPLLFLRAQAMTERQVTYGASEISDIAPSFDLALPRLGALLALLRRRSDGEFGEVVCKPIPDSQDSRVCWYYHKAGQFICGSLRDPRGLEKCRAYRAAHMEQAYGAYEGVGPLTQARDQLQQSRDALEITGILDQLTHAGVEVNEVVLAEGRFQRRSPSKGADTWFA
jgi:hypothetical protein